MEKTGLGEAENRGGGRSRRGLSRGPVPAEVLGSKLMDERWLTGADGQLWEAIADSRILARVRAGIYICAQRGGTWFLQVPVDDHMTIGVWLTGWRANMA